MCWKLPFKLHEHESHFMRLPPCMYGSVETIQSGMSAGDMEGEKKYGHHTEKTLIKYVDSLGHLY